MSDEIMANEYGEAIKGMTSTACNAVLERLSHMAANSSTREALEHLHRLTRMAREISNLVERGNHAFENGRPGNASDRWSRALMLMDIMSIDAESLEQELSPNNIALPQNSGKTG